MPRPHNIRSIRTTRIKRTTSKAPQPPQKPQVRPVQGLWHLLRRAWDDFNKDNGSLMAAALSFYALLSLIPMLLVAISVFGYLFGSAERGSEQVFKFVQGYLLPTASDSVRELVDQVVKARGVIGGFGLLSLLWTSLQGLLILETAVNAIWNRKPRNYLMGRVFALVSLIALGILFAVSVGMTSAQTALSHIDGFEWMAGESSSRLLTRAGTLLASTTMFVLVFALFPTRPVRFLDALKVGFVIALIWEVAKFGYVWYVGHLANFGSVYGPLGGLIGLVTWIYASSFLVLFGSEVVHALTEQD